MWRQNIGADGGTRTRTVVLGPEDFKSSASAISPHPHFPMFARPQLGIVIRKTGTGLPIITTPVHLIVADRFDRKEFKVPRSSG